jgi:threonine/homoserine/homoserine lactone efflux protein
VDYSWSFLLVAIALVLTPGADFAVIVRNSLSGGRRHGAATTLGVSSAAALQGLLVTAGVAGVIVRVQPVFLAIKWAGVAYLAWLAFSLLRSAARGDYADVGQVQRQQAWTAYRQGFLCNATNPKILVFYLSLLPQFVARDAPWPVWLVHAWTVPFLGTLWCLSVVAFVSTVRTWLQRRTVRRALDAAAGLVLIGFCARLASES